MIRVYLKHAAPVEVLDDDRRVLACFQLAEVAGYAIDPPEGPERP